MISILMVCLGNICRSPLAEGILQNKLPDHKFFVSSAGTANFHTGEKPDYRSIQVAKNHSIDISKQRAIHFQPHHFDEFDYIFAMDKNNYATILAMAPNETMTKKVKLILNNNQEVPDPYYGDLVDFEHVFQLLDVRCNGIANELQSLYL